jgi:hypothetical protein
MDFELSAKHTSLPTSPTRTLLTSFLAATNYKNTFLRTLVPSVGLVYGIQAAVAISSILVKNERFYDFSGSITYLSYTALSLFLPAIRAISAAALTGDFQTRVAKSTQCPERPRRSAWL